MTVQTERGKIEQAARLAGVRSNLHDFFGEQLIKPPVREDQPKEALIDRWKSVAEILEVTSAWEIVEHIGCEDFSSDALNRELSDLFVVPTGRYLAPIESVYIGARARGDDWEPGLLRGEPWLHVTECYRRAGYANPPQSGFESDHLACELQFLALLCRTEQQAWLHGDFDAARELRMMQHEFITAHPLAWIGSLRQRFSRVSKNVYYGNLLSLIDAHLQTERAHLSDEQER